MNDEASQRRIARLYVQRDSLYETLPDVSLVLNLGAGSGSFSKGYRHPDCLIVCVDKNEPIAGYPAYGAAHKTFRGFAALGPDPRCVCVPGDVLEILPRLPSKVFEMVVAGQLIEHFVMRDLELLLHEAHRVLRHGGTLQVDTVTGKLGESTDGHEQSFTGDSLCELLERMTFARISVSEFADGAALWATAQRIRW